MTRETTRTQPVSRKDPRPDPGGPHKACTKCGQAKPPNAFYAKPGARDGLFGQCKACILEDRRSAYQSRPEMRQRIKAQARAWRLSHPRTAQPDRDR